MPTPLHWTCPLAACSGPSAPDTSIVNNVLSQVILPTTPVGFDELSTKNYAIPSIIVTKYKKCTSVIFISQSSKCDHRETKNAEDTWHALLVPVIIFQHDMTTAHRINKTCLEWLLIYPLYPCCILDFPEHNWASEFHIRGILHSTNGVQTQAIQMLL